MGELQGKKSQKGGFKSIPASVETMRSFHARMVNFWDRDIVPLLYKSEGSTTETLHILVVSHGALISRLVHEAFVVQRQYEAGPDVRPGWIVNTSITIVELTANGEGGEIGTLLKFADVSHLVDLKVEVVKSNADDVETEKTGV